MKRKLLIGIIAVTVFAFGVGIVAAKADFSGVWTLDAGKSEGLPAGLMQTMTITQKDDLLEIEIKSKVGEKERTGKEAYVLDGKENDLTTVPGSDGRKSKRVSKWTDDGNSFEVTEEHVMKLPDGGESTDRVKRRWSLSADGKTLSIEAEVENSKGTSKTKRVFVKK